MAAAESLKPPSEIAELSEPVRNISPITPEKIDNTPTTNIQNLGASRVKGNLSVIGDKNL